MKQIKKCIAVALLILGSAAAFAAGSKKSSGVNLYLGSDIGMAVCDTTNAGFGGFLRGVEVVPYVGLRPVSKAPGLSFELDVQMDFIGQKITHTESGNYYTYTRVSQFNYNHVAPQLLIGYEYDIGFFKPYFKLGTGVNFHSAKATSTTTTSSRFTSDTTSTDTNTYKIDPSWNFVANLGARWLVSNNFAINAGARFSYDFAKVENYDEKVFLGTTAFNAGAEFRF